MPTAAQNVQTSIDQIAANIQAITATPGPDVSVGGRSINKAAYLATLTKSMDELIDLQRRLSSPFEVRTIG